MHRCWPELHSRDSRQPRQRHEFDPSFYVNVCKQTLLLCATISQIMANVPTLPCHKMKGFGAGHTNISEYLFLMISVITVSMSPLTE